MSEKSFTHGEKVKWSSHGGTAHGKIVRKLTEDCDIKGHHVSASDEDPRWLVETDDGDRAAHKAEALSKDP